MAASYSKRIKTLKARFKPALRASFYTDSVSFLREEIKVSDMLSQMAANARLSKSKKRRRQGEIYLFMISEMTKEGETFAMALSKIVPSEEAMLVLSGERSDALLDAMSQLASLIERKIAASLKLQKTIIGSLGYFAMSTAFIIFVALKMDPIIANAATPAEIAAMRFAPFYLSFTEGYVHYGPFVGALLVIATIYIIRSLSRWTGPRRKKFDEGVPPWSIYHRMQATMFLITASVMLKTGAKLSTIMEETSKLGNPWFRWQARRVLALLESGETEVGALQSGILPADTMERLRIYAKLPDFHRVMTRLADDNFVMYMAHLDRIGKTAGWIGKLFFAFVVMGVSFSIMDFMMAIQSTAKF